MVLCETWNDLVGHGTRVAATARALVHAVRKCLSPACSEKILYGIALLFNEAVSCGQTVVRHPGTGMLSMAVMHVSPWIHFLILHVTVFSCLEAGMAGSLR